MSVSKLTDWPSNEISLEEFRRKVWLEGTKHNRNDLPWRFINDPYKVLVSEVMLQQTQVKRVLSYWPNFLAQFPDISTLAQANTADVLKAWQGLGYNRRALALQNCVRICVEQYEGELPNSDKELLNLPGIGPATAAGVQAFARNKPGVYLETNVRSVFLHELFPNEVAVSDKQLEPLVKMACPQEEPRKWYYALLDYGAHLKTQIANPSRRSAGYTRQSKFEGSHRQKRSFILQQVLEKPGVSTQKVFEDLNKKENNAGRKSVSQKDFELIVNELVGEGFFSKTGNKLG